MKIGLSPLRTFASLIPPDALRASGPPATITPKIGRFSGAPKNRPRVARVLRGDNPIFYAHNVVLNHYF